MMAQKLVNFPVMVVFRPTPCEWRLSSPSEDVGLASYTRGSVKPGERKLDPWSVRKEFLGLNTTAALTGFLRRTGVFILFENGFRDLIQWQLLIRELMATNPQRWPTLVEHFDKQKVNRILQEDRADCAFLWNDGKPHARLWTPYTLRAMVVSIQVDHLRGAKFRFCMKPDCGKEYEVRSSHARLYCSQECAHHASVRRNREKRRRERQAQK